jgi:hypothetical protein
MQAIKTKYLGPTNVRGSRVKAECDAMSIIISWDDALDIEANHIAAARELCNRLVAKNEKLYGKDAGNGWNAPFVTGGLKNDGYAHVFTR